MNQSSQRDEREKKRLREKLIWQREERERERERTKARFGLSLNWSHDGLWWWLVMVTIGVVVVACGGTMKVQWEERTLGKRKKWRRRRDRDQNGLEWECQTNFWLETLCDGISHTGGSHYLLNFTKMPLKLNSKKLKTSKICFLFP